MRGLGAALAGRAQAQTEGAGLALDRLQRAGLEQGRAGQRRLAHEQGVELLSPQRPAEAAPRRVGRRQRRDHARGAAHERDPAQLGAGEALDLGADTEGIEQREVAGGDALAADLAPRKALALDQRHRPAGARQQDRRRGAGRTRADDRDVEARAHRSRPPTSVAQKQWVKRPSSYSSSCQALGRLDRVARRRPGLPGVAQLLADEAGAHAEHAVAPRHRVRAEEEDQVRGAEREAAAPRLAGGERIGAAGAAGEQATQSVAVEMMEEQVGDDHVPVLRRVAIGGPVEHVGDPRPRLPAGRGIGGDRLRIDDRLAIEQVELDLGPAVSAVPGDLEHQPAVAAADLEDAQPPADAAHRLRRSRPAPSRARARGCRARP